MNQATKVAIISLIIILSAAGLFFFQKNKVVLPPSDVQVVDVPVAVTEENTTVEEKNISTIEGKTKSINQTQLYLELSEGKGAAINIEASVPVQVEGEDKISNLSILEMGKMVIVQIDENNNAINVLIKK